MLNEIQYDNILEYPIYHPEPSEIFNYKKLKMTMKAVRLSVVEALYTKFHEERPSTYVLVSVVELSGRQKLGSYLSVIYDLYQW